MGLAVENSGEAVMAEGEGKDTETEAMIAVKAEAEKKVKFDDILADLGDFGRYQKVAYFLLFLPTIFSAMQKQSWVFLGAKAPHRCKLPGDYPNSTYDNPDLNLTS